MSAVEWNLESLDIATVRVFQVVYSSDAVSDTEFASDRRLLVLSHAIAYAGIPALWVRQTPSYLKRRESGASVLVFDLKDEFGRFKLPVYVTDEATVFEIARPFASEFYDQLQRALCLASYYELRELKPLYFTSFLLIPGSGSKSEPFLYQRVPVRKNKKLCMRTTMKGSLDFVVDMRLPVPAGSFVLVPPYEHPFYVMSCAQDKHKMSLLSVEKEFISIDYTKTVFVLITRPPVQMASFYEMSEQSKAPAARRMCQFETKEWYEFPQEDIDSFIAARFAVDESGPDEEKKETMVSVFEYPEITIEQVLSQMISDEKERQAIFECLGPEGTLPSRRFELHIRAASFLSFFRFDFGFSDVKPPYHAQSLIRGSRCEYERLGIPGILVGCDGAISNASASEVIDNWVEKRYQPISGPKSGHYIVVSTPDIPIEHAKLFFKQLSHIYTLHEFGTLTPFPRFEAYYSIPVADMSSFIMSFYNDQLLSEFQQFHLLTFIVGPPIYDSGFRPHSILSYVRPESIDTAGHEEISAFAFVVYSRIRNFSPAPYGMISLAPASLGDAGSLFFGYRYQPPFVLPRQNERKMTMHVAWDQAQNMSAWMDDIGSVLQFIPNTPLGKIIQTMGNCVKIMEGTEVRFTISVLAEGLSPELLSQIETALGPFLPNTTIFSVSPEPTVQVLFKEEFQDDAVIIADAEQYRSSTDGEFARPYATCYVVAHTLPAYSVCVYTKPTVTSPETTLMEYVKQMSHLSWLSVKPGSRSRTISYPPHICALIRKNSASTTILSRYEFLPSIEII